MRSPRSLSPLRHRPFRLLAGGQLASNLGDSFYAVALPWYVLAHHGGALLLGTVLAAYGLPRTVLVAVGGHASDWFRPWTVMMVSDFVRMVAVAALAAVAMTGPASAWTLVPIAVVLGAGAGLFLPASFSIVPSLLPDEHLQAGNGLIDGGTQLATLIGPAVGGVVVALLGPAPAFAIDAGSFALSVLSLAGIRSAHNAAREESGAASALTSLSERLSLSSVLRQERVLQVILLIAVAANIGFGGLGEVALPVLARGPFHLGASGYGGLVAAFGGGALLGTLAAAQLNSPRRPAITASLAYLLSAVFLALVPFVGGAIPAGVGLVGFGAMNGFGNVVTITAFQRWAPPQLLGRVMGLLLLASFGLFPLSVILGAAVVHSVGPALFFPLTAGILALAVLGGLTQAGWRTFGATNADEPGGSPPAPDAPGAEPVAPVEGRIFREPTLAGPDAG